MKGQLKAVPLRLECKGYGGNLEPSGEGEACHRPPSSDGRGLKKAVTLREEGQSGLGAIPPPCFWTCCFPPSPLLDLLL